MQKKTLQVVGLAAGVSVLIGAGGATAASLIRGSDIASNTITARNIKTSTITGKQVRNGSITLADLSPATRKLVLDKAKDGAKGDTGATGAAGGAGGKGDTGATGGTGAKGDKGDKGDTGATGANADGSVTSRVRGSGDAGVSLSNIPSGTAGVGSHATGSITPDGFRSQIDANGGGFARLTLPFAAGTPLSDLRALLYKWSVTTRNAGTVVAPALKLDITDASPCTVGVDGCTNAVFANNSTTLVFEPTYTVGTATSGTTDTLDAATPSKWWSTRGITGAKNRDTFVSLASIIAANPNAKIQSVYVESGQNSAGGPWNNFDGLVDYVNLGIAGGGVDRFDFGS